MSAGGIHAALQNHAGGELFELGLMTAALLVVALLLARSSLAMNVKRQGVDEDIAPPQLKIGLNGVATSCLRPAGTARFGKLTLDVLTDGEEIKKGSRVVITDQIAEKIFVEELR